MRPPDILEPVLAGVGHDAKHPRVESPADFAEVLVRLDERGLKNVFGDVRTSRHAERVPVKRIAVARDQNPECVLGAGEYTTDYLLVGIDLIDGRTSRFHRCHHASVTFPLSGG